MEWMNEWNCLRLSNVQSFTCFDCAIVLIIQIARLFGCASHLGELQYITPEVITSISALPYEIECETCYALCKALHCSKFNWLLWIIAHTVWHCVSTIKLKLSTHNIADRNVFSLEIVLCVSRSPPLRSTTYCVAWKNSLLHFIILIILLNSLSKKRSVLKNTWEIFRRWIPWMRNNITHNIHAGIQWNKQQ